MQNTVLWSPLQMKFAGKPRLAAEGSGCFAEKERGGKSSQDPTTSICSCCPWRLSVHGRTVAWKGIAVLNAASSQEISWYSGLDYAGCPRFISAFNGESPFSFQKPSAVNSSLSATGEKSLLLLYLLSGFQGTNSFCKATRKQGQIPSGRKKRQRTWQVNVLTSECFLWEKPGHQRNSGMCIPAGTWGQETKWKTLTTAVGSAETFGPVQPSLIPAQDSNFIKFLFNPWIFFLGDE